MRRGFRWQVALGAVAVLVAAAASARDAAAVVLARTTPQAALSIKSHHGEAVGRLVDAKLARDKVTAPGAAQQQAVRRAYRSDPLNARLVRQLALGRVEAGDPKGSEALLNLGDRISRRDEMTQVLLAQRAAERGDLRTGIAKLSIVLSTSKSLHDQVFPLLAKVVGDPEFRGTAPDFIKPSWGPGFMAYAAANVDPLAVLDLALRAPQMQTDPRYIPFTSELVDRLARQGHEDRALAYLQRHPQFAANIAGKPGFDRQTTDFRYAPGTWRMAQDQGVYAGLDGQTVSVSLDPASSGKALERAFVVEPGRYRVVITHESADGLAPPAARWTFECSGSGARAQLGALTPAPSAAGTQSVAELTVPAGCSAMVARLDARNAAERDPAEFRVSAFTLERR